MYVNGVTATFTDCEIYSNSAGTSVRLGPGSFHGPHGKGVQELTSCPCDAMPRILPRRCRGCAAARYAPFHGPHGRSVQELTLLVHVRAWRREG